jgi:hypothetical protein
MVVVDRINQAFSVMVMLPLYAILIAKEKGAVFAYLQI